VEALPPAVTGLHTQLLSLKLRVQQEREAAARLRTLDGVIAHAPNLDPRRLPSIKRSVASRERRILCACYGI
jgi:hypothetical protein